MGACLVVITAASGIVGERVADSLPLLPDVAWWLLFAALLISEIYLAARYAQLPNSAASVPRRAVDDLADAVESQWSKEAATRAIDYPASIRVRWKELHRRGWLRPEAILGHPIESEPHVFRIRGDVSTVATAFLGLPRAQLCVLGRPGGGKSVLVVLLTLRLLDAP